MPFQTLLPSYLTPRAERFYDHLIQMTKNIINPPADLESYLPTYPLRSAEALPAVEHDCPWFPDASPCARMTSEKNIRKSVP